ncbi:MAG TPA: SLATT domain-containing protein [Candidatus Saccharibacteria bacterium]|nr:SLATT domain-containing protein [Candidatus Saccharibacteria bacterium]HRK94508.1 SLATT domain-containing protein [Candidatus Saccharibacteria bacterium]
MKMPDELPKTHEALGHEIDRLHESAKWSSQGQFEQMKIWRLANLLFGLPAAVLAAISGGTGLANVHSADPSSTPAILALLSAGFGAALTTLNPSRRVTQAQAAGNAYLEVQTAARQLLNVDLVEMSFADARAKLEELTVRRDEINKTADPPSRLAYWRAKRNLTKDGGQDYEIDNGKGGGQ